MVMYQPPQSSSAGTRSIHHELQLRKSKPLAPTRSVAKKPSASPPSRHGSSDAFQDQRPPLPHREVLSLTISHSRGSTVTNASPQPRPRSSSRCNPASPPPPPPRSDTSSTGSACRASPGVPAYLKPGTVVRVRTRIATLKTGQVLVLWLKATVVSTSTDGGYGVVYDANWPRSDPKSTIYVAPHQVRLINPYPSPTPPTPSLLPPATAIVAATMKKEMPRPTTAGKGLRLIRSLFPEMELPAWA